MRTALVRSAAGRTQAGPSPARPASSHPLATLQRSAGNQALQRAMSSGAPLPRELRGPLEAHFRTPLDRVRLHRNEASQSLADSLGARAFTLGQDIHLGTDGARASGPDLRKLVAHEVVHTLQQGQVGPRAKVKVGAPHDAHEREADLWSAATPVAAISHAEPSIQRSMLPAHYGTFEDVSYDFLTDATSGAKIGVEMYLKFHPGTNARSDIIALTQAARGIQSGAIYAPDARGMHHATSGAGVGYFIDQNPGNANPLYAANLPKQGGDPTKITDYDTVPVTPLTAAEQAQDAKASGIKGRHYTGGGRHGYRKVQAGNFVTQDAELWDAPTFGASYANSSQIFETAALALEGPQQNTYYGSVEWGWQSDARGNVTKLPFRLVSQGVPSVNFLTAATIWNAGRVDFALEVTAATSMLSAVTFAPITSLNAGDHVKPTGRTTTSSGTAYTEVSMGGWTGLVDTTLLRPVALGAQTIDLPVPMVHTVTNPNGTSMVPRTTGTPNVLVPNGTRISVMRCMAPTKQLPNHSEGRIVDGPLIGTEGYFFAPDLTLEKVGTR